MNVFWKAWTCLSQCIPVNFQVPLHHWKVCPVHHLEAPLSYWVCVWCCFFFFYSGRDSTAAVLEMPAHKDRHHLFISWIWQHRRSKPFNVEQLKAAVLRGHIKHWFYVTLQTYPFSTRACFCIINISSEVAMILFLSWDFIHAITLLNGHNENDWGSDLNLNFML